MACFRLRATHTFGRLFHIRPSSRHMTASRSSPYGTREGSSLAVLASLPARCGPRSGRCFLARAPRCARPTACAKRPQNRREAAVAGDPSRRPRGECCCVFPARDLRPGPSLPPAWPSAATGVVGESLVVPGPISVPPLGAHSLYLGGPLPVTLLGAPGQRTSSAFLPLRAHRPGSPFCAQIRGFSLWKTVGCRGRDVGVQVEDTEDQRNPLELETWLAFLAQHSLCS